MYPIIISVRSYPKYMRAIIGTHVHTITKSKVVTLPVTMAVTQITGLTKPRSDLDSDNGSTAQCTSNDETRSDFSLISVSSHHVEKRCGRCLSPRSLHYVHLSMRSIGSAHNHDQMPIIASAHVHTPSPS